MCRPSGKLLKQVRRATVEIACEGICRRKKKKNDVTKNVLPAKRYCANPKDHGQTLIRRTVITSGYRGPRPYLLSDANAGRQ